MATASIAINPNQAMYAWNISGNVAMGTVAKPIDF